MFISTKMEKPASCEFPEQIKNCWSPGVNNIWDLTWLFGQTFGSRVNITVLIILQRISNLRLRRFKYRRLFQRKLKRLRVGNFPKQGKNLTRLLGRTSTVHALWNCHYIYHFIDLRNPYSLGISQFFDCPGIKARCRNFVLHGDFPNSWSVLKRIRIVAARGA